VVSWALGLVDTIGGRLSGTAAGARAEAWALARLREIGVDSAWLEPVAFWAWERGPATMTVSAPAALAGRPLAVSAWAYAPGGMLSGARVVDLGRGDTLALRRAGPAVRGAVLLCDAVGPELVRAAAEAGAAALLRISPEPGRLLQARAVAVERPPAPVPVWTTTLEDGLWLRRMALYGDVRVDARVDARAFEAQAHNVVGQWRGRAGGDEVVLVGAHLDAWDVGAGAIDNGSGVLAALETVRALVASGRRPRRTVRVVLFAGEELGLAGSRAYVARHRATLGRVVAMMNFDMVGWPDGYGATGHAEADTLFARLARLPPLDSLGLSTQVEHGGGAGSDHQPFVLAGVPTIFVRTSLPPETVRWYHNAGDTLDKLDLDGIRRTAAAAAVAVWAIADAPLRVLRHLDARETGELVRRLGWPVAVP
jgi:carboxypeptidase Q